MQVSKDRGRWMEGRSAGGVGVKDGLKLVAVGAGTHCHMWSEPEHEQRPDAEQKSKYWMQRFGGEKRRKGKDSRGANRSQVRHWQEAKEQKGS